MLQPATMTPGAILDWGWDWATRGWLQSGETITTYSITYGANLSEVSKTQASGIVTASVMMSATAPIGIYTTMTCKIVTNQGRTDSRDIILVAQSRSGA